MKSKIRKTVEAISQEWTKEDELTLFKQILKVLPENDKMKISRRIDNVEWEKVKFKSYSAEDCKKYTIHVAELKRQYKNLYEILKDAEVLINNSKITELQQINHQDQPLEKPVEAKELYFRDYKDELLKQNPQLDMEGARKILNERFNILDDEKKAVYKKKSKKISTEYHHNVNRLLNRIPGFPSQPTSTFGFYFTDHREELLTQNPQLDSKKLKQILLDRFISPDSKLEKAGCTERAVKAAEEYRLKLEQLMKDSPDYAAAIEYHLKVKLRHHPHAPKKPISAFSLYLSKHKDEVFKTNPALSSRDVRNILFERFSLDVEQKTVYLERAQNAFKEYNLKLEQFLKDHPEYEKLGSLQSINEKTDESLSAATDLQSDSYSEGVIASVERGIKRPATEEESSEIKMKKTKICSAEIDEVVNNPNETQEWSKEDDLKLIGRIPFAKRDNLRSTKAIEILKWDDKVKFKSFSEEDCKKRLMFITKRLRKHKVLSEILEESVQFLEKAIERSQDVSLPTKPEEACMLYYQENKDEVLKQNPKLNLKKNGVNAIFKIFESLDFEKKVVYMDKAAKAKEEYLLKLKQLLSFPVQSDNTRERLSKRLNLLGIEELFPELSDLFSTPLKAIQLFYIDHKDELLIQNPLLTEAEAKKILSKRFSMDFEKKAVYKEKYDISVMEQQRKLEQLSKKYPDPTTVIGCALKKKFEELTLTPLHPDAPKRPPKAESLYFLEHKEEFLKHNPSFSIEDVRKILSERFLNLDLEQKTLYTERAAKAMEEYWLKFEQFLKDHPEYKRHSFIQHDVRTFAKRQSLLASVQIGIKRPAEFVESKPKKSKRPSGIEVQNVSAGSHLTDPTGKPAMATIEIEVEQKNTEQESGGKKQKKKKKRSPVVEVNSIK